MKLTGSLSSPFGGGAVPSDGSSTFANRGVGSSVGVVKRMTDIGGPAGTWMMWDGTYWVVLAPCRAIFDPALSSGDTTGNEQILKTGSLPIGILRACKYFTITIVFAKSLNAEATTNIRCRLGSAGSLADTVLWEGAPGFSSATHRTLAVETSHFLSSATNVRQYGAHNLGGLSGGSNGFSTPQDKTIPNADSTALFLTASMDMAGTAENPQVASMELCLQP